MQLNRETFFGTLTIIGVLIGCIVVVIGTHYTSNSQKDNHQKNQPSKQKALSFEKAFFCKTIFLFSNYSTLQATGSLRKYLNRFQKAFQETWQ